MRKAHLVFVTTLLLFAGSGVALTQHHRGWDGHMSIGYGDYWRGNCYSPPLYAGNIYYPRAPQPVCWQDCWQEPIYDWVWVTRYDHRRRPYSTQEWRLVGYQTRCQTRCAN